MKIETLNNNSQENLPNLPEWTKRIIERAKELIQQKENEELKTIHKEILIN